MTGMQQWKDKNGYCFWWRKQHEGMPSTLTWEEALATEYNYIMQEPILQEYLKKHPLKKPTNDNNL